MYNKKLDKWGDPQEYKGIKFYPLKIFEEDAYNFIANMLSYNKNVFHYAFIKMSYLKFILTQLQTTDYNIAKELQEWMSYITQKDAIVYYFQDNNIPQNETLSHLRFEMIIDGVKFTEYEFDKIREILLEQNGISIEHINEYDPVLEESLSFIHRDNNFANFEEQVFSMCLHLKKTIEEIKNITFYQFKKFVERARLQIDYEIFKPLEISGQISFKDKNNGINDWLSHVADRGRYDEILIRKDTFVKDNDVFKVSQSK